MGQLRRVAATRRLPAACEARLLDGFDVALGDDDACFDSEALIAHAQGAEALIVSATERMDRATIEALPAGLKVIATVSVGYEHIDLAAARAAGIRVTNTPDVL